MTEETGLREWIAELIVENDRLSRLANPPTYSRIKLMRYDDVLYDMVVGHSTGLDSTFFEYTLNGVTGVRVKAW